MRSGLRILLQDFLRFAAGRVAVGVILGSFTLLRLLLGKFRFPARRVEVLQVRQRLVPPIGSLLRAPFHTPKAPLLVLRLLSSREFPRPFVQVPTSFLRLLAPVVDLPESLLLPF